MKSPGSGGSKSSPKGGKAGSKGKSGGKFPTKKALRREYKGEARREEASARREEHDASHRRAEAEHYRQEAAKAEHEGHKKEAEYDLAKARREQAAARHDMAKARRNQAKAGRNRHKAAHVGLTQPPTFGAESWNHGMALQWDLHPWILGGNDWHRGCAAVALANHLYAATGLRVSDRDVLDLYWLTADDPGAGAGVLATLEAAAEFGLGDYRPTFALCGFPAADGEFVGLPDLVVHADAADQARGLHEWPHEFAGEAAGDGRHAIPLQDHGLALRDLLDLGPDLAGPRPGGEKLPVAGHADADGVAHPLIVDLRLQRAQRHQPVWDASPSPDWGAHAGVLAGDRVITWGREVPVTGDFLAQRVAGAWTVEWLNAIPALPR